MFKPHRIHIDQRAGNEHEFLTTNTGLIIWTYKFNWMAQKTSDLTLKSQLWRKLTLKFFIWQLKKSWCTVARTTYNKYVDITSYLICDTIKLTSTPEIYIKFWDIALSKMTQNCQRTSDQITMLADKWYNSKWVIKNVSLLCSKLSTGWIGGFLVHKYPFVEWVWHPEIRLLAYIGFCKFTPLHRFSNWKNFVQ